MATERDDFLEKVSQPFQPTASGEGAQGIDHAARVADALEYIAAQLGEICRKMDHLAAGRSPTAEDFERMNELLAKL